MYFLILANNLRRRLSVINYGSNNTDDNELCMIVGQLTLQRKYCKKLCAPRASWKTSFGSLLNISNYSQTIILYNGGVKPHTANNNTGKGPILSLLATGLHK